MKQSKLFFKNTSQKSNGTGPAEKDAASSQVVSSQRNEDFPKENVPHIIASQTEEVKTDVKVTETQVKPFIFCPLITVHLIHSSRNPQRPPRRETSTTCKYQNHNNRIIARKSIRILLWTARPLPKRRDSAVQATTKHLQVSELNLTRS